VRKPIRQTAAGKHVRGTVRSVVAREKRRHTLFDGGQVSKICAIVDCDKKKKTWGERKKRAESDEIGSTRTIPPRT